MDRCVLQLLQVLHNYSNFQATGGAAKGLHTLPGSVTSSQITGSPNPTGKDSSSLLTYF